MSSPTNDHGIPHESIIMVMGVTGSGKSTFINTVSGDSLQTSDRLGSCTAEVQLCRQFEVEGRKVRLVDTPGFNDTTRSDTEVLGVVGEWMKTSYHRDRQLVGIIYCHRITDRRFDGSAKKSLQIFQNICGEAFLKNVILVTTMWNEVSSPEEGEKRECQLAENFWKEILSRKATMARYDGKQESGYKILERLLKTPPATPAFQQELAIDNLLLGETAAGRALMAVIIAMEAEHRENLEAANSEFDRAAAENNEIIQRLITEELERLQADLQKAQNDRKKLGVKLGYVDGFVGCNYSTSPDDPSSESELDPDCSSPDWSAWKRFAMFIIHLIRR